MIADSYDPKASSEEVATQLVTTGGAVCEAYKADPKASFKEVAAELAMTGLEVCDPKASSKEVDAKLAMTDHEVYNANPKALSKEVALSWLQVVAMYVKCTRLIPRRRLRRWPQS